MAQSSSTSSSEARPAGRWPKAALWSVAGCLVLTGLCWAGVWVAAAPADKCVLLVGDSFTGNYRFEAGSRLQDLMEAELPDDWSARNFARPGARTLDMLMQVYQAETLMGRVDRVVLPLFVTKLAVGPGYIRLDKRGDNLKWLPLTGRAPAPSEILNDEEQKKLVIHKLGLLVGFYDLIEYLYVEHFQSPRERAEMRLDPPSRRAKINAKNARRAKGWDTYELDWTDRRDMQRGRIATSQAAIDLDLLIRVLEDKGIPLLIIWLPMGNMDIVRDTFSPRAQANLARVAEVARGWSDARGVPSVDLIHGLPGVHYDDFTHLKTVEGNRIVAHIAAQWAQTGSTDGLQP